MGEVARGDTHAFEVLVRRHRKRILNLIFRLTGDHVQAEDLAQEVFVRIWQAAANYQPKAKFTTWAYRITANLCLDLVKSAHHRQKFVCSAEDDSFDSCADKLNTPEDLVLASEKSRQLSAALRSLPANQRLAVVLKRFEGLSYEEIAKIMGCSVSAVESLLVRAKKTLREKLLSADRDQAADSPFITAHSLIPETSQSF